MITLCQLHLLPLFIINKNFRLGFSDVDEETPSSSKKRKLHNEEPTTSSAAGNCKEVIKEASPLCFLLTKVSGIPPQYNSHKAVHISGESSTSVLNVL